VVEVGFEGYYYPGGKVRLGFDLLSRFKLGATIDTTYSMNLQFSRFLIGWYYQLKSNLFDFPSPKCFNENVNTISYLKYRGK